MTDDQTPPETGADDTASDDGTTSEATPGSPAAVASTPAPKKRRNFFRRHLALTSLAVIFVLILGTAGGFVWYLNHALGNIKTFDAGITPKPGTGGGSSDSGQPINVLVLGSDDGNNVQTVADDLKDGTWTRGAHRSDTMILLHIPANRQSAQIISIPRDSWVKVPGFPGDINGYAKINAAFSWGGPKLAVTTVQNFTGLHIDHVAMIDWNGFKGLTDALGGVRVYIPQTFTDDTQHVTWTKGWQTLDGDKALQYVRTRHGLANGDFGRIQRQQNFLRTIMDSLLSTSTFTNPIKLAHVVNTLSDFIEVDSTWTSGDIRSLALSLRGLHSSSVQFTTAPFGSYATIGGQSTVQLDLAKCKVLFQQFDNGSIASYLHNNPGSGLPGSTSVK